MVRLLSKLRTRAESIGKLFLYPGLSIYRGFCRKTAFVGITGSCGKTTTLYLTNAVLSSRFHGVAPPPGPNRARGLVKTIPFVRRRHRYCIVELGAFGKDTLDELINVLKPQIGVVTNVGFEHLSAFKDLKSVASEKVKLVRALPANGTAILNYDDPYVRKMASESRGKVLFFGSSKDAEIRVDDVSSIWPDRLSFVVSHKGLSHLVQTRLCGRQWVPSVLAALAVGLELGIPLEEGIQRLGEIEPFTRRVEPVVNKKGVELIRDDWKGSGWTVPLAVEFMSEAQARRRIFVLGQISDDRRKPKILYRQVASEAKEVSDLVCLFGQWAHHGLRARASESDESILAFPTAKEVFEFLEKQVEPGDLVYVKASGKNDHALNSALSREFWVPVSNR